jgi:hypothetical protein
VDADLFAHDLVAGEVRQDCLLCFRVDQRRIVAALTVPDDAFPLASGDAVENSVDVVARSATKAQPIG